MKLIARLLIIVTLLTQASYSFSQSKEKVRFDGLYQTVSEIDSISNVTSYRYLRFYPDGKVLSVTSTDNVYYLKKWFNLKQKNPSVGIYELTAKRIYFTTTSNYGTVVYDGQINDKYYLDLSVKSLINGHLSQVKYYFVKVKGMR
jgi:hypothetical protein